ncbi:hypothetical protein BZA05DRAFT_477518 [Tricharina praecox]|uniref:uncharacterized protein n=1 Tax=Tricharina praecox TaxID=43433 RepID=UPI00222033C2|nr:uncharacterized protein BZA05DRAFT_477518 [Tricharina praecox]KAI5842373.1 hypothetical protein BZA05DRAFT_477518 [Tricharina praecox]
MATVVFAANNESYRKRRRAHRACEQCKRRRRRCEPPFENHDRCAGCTRDGIACSLVIPSPSPNPNPLLPLTPPPPPPTPPGDHPEASTRPRFVGDLNPESVFLTSAAVPQQRDLAECGVWAVPSPTSPQPPPQHHQHHQQQHVHHQQQHHQQHRQHQHNPHIPPHLPRAYLTYLDSIGAFSLPTLRAREALVGIFFECVQPLLPLLDEPVFRDQHAKSTVSIPLLHAVLMVSARYPNAARYLPAGVSARSFAQSTADKVEALLHGGVERERLTLVRIHALLAFHSEGPSGNEIASLHLSTAVHHAYSLGLHLDRRVINREELRLWWVLWALDALQASLCGRPVGVRREDVSVPTPEQWGERGLFVAAMTIADVLTDVIKLYRPGNTVSGWEGPWITLESLLPPGGDTGVAANTLRLFYHAVTILSYRSSFASSFVSTHTSASYARRMSSAHAILALFSAPNNNPFPPLPVVPYAVSLALTSFFSALRADPDSPHTAEYKSSFLRACSILEELSTYWFFAGAMAAMGRQAIERMAVKEAAGVLRVLSGNAGEEQTVNVGDAGGGEDGVEAWFLQLFPDLALPTGLFGNGAGDAVGALGWEEPVQGAGAGMGAGVGAGAGVGWGGY